MIRKIKIQNIFYSYGRSSRALEDCSLDITCGRVLGLVGPNGSGKTTLLSLLSRQRRLQKGNIFIEGNGNYESLRIGWASSEYLLYDSVKISVFIEKTYGPALGLASTTAAKRGKTLANRLGMESYYYKRPRDLSHGTRIKTAVILSLLEHPDLIILDEPFNGLDVHSVDQLIAILKEEFRDRKCTIIIADHQVGVLENLINDVAFIQAGRIHDQGSSEEFISGYGSLTDAYRSLIKPDISS